MVWKTVLNNDAGSSTVFGGDDIDKISKLFSGVPDIDTVDINSILHLNSGKLRVYTTARDQYYSIQASDIDSAYSLFLPLLSDNDTLTANLAAAELRNKIIDGRYNVLTGVIGFPTMSKWGQIQCASATESGDGLLNGHTKIGTPVVAPDVDGSFQRYSTGTTPSTARGIKMPAAFLRRDYNPRLKVKFRAPAATSNDQRVFIGFSSNTADITGNTPLAASDKGFMIGHGTADTSYRVFSSDGVGGASFSGPVTGTPTKNNAIHTMEVRMSNANSTIYYSFDGADPETGITSEIPAATDALTIHIVSSNSTTTSRNFDIFYVELESDR